MSPPIECKGPDVLRRPMAHDTADLRELARASAIEDPWVLSVLARQGIRFDTVDTFALLPLAEVAWADGAVDAAERQIIRRIVQRCAGSAAGMALIESWLTSKPGHELHEVWCLYVAELADTADTDLWAEWRRELLFAARDVAIATGEPLGRGVSAAEAAVIRAVAAALPLRPRRRSVAVRTPYVGGPAPGKERPCN